MSETQEAIVLTGAAANAAYEVGVLKALLGGKWGQELHEQVDPFCIAGTSVGALNAAVVASHTKPTSGVEKLDHLWRERIPGTGATNGIFRVRMDPFQYMSPESYAPNPLKPLIEMGGDVVHVGWELLRRLGYGAALANTPHDASIALTDFSELLDISPLRDLLEDEVELGRIERSSRQLRISVVNWETGGTETFDQEQMRAPHGYDIIQSAVAIPGVVPAQAVDGYPHVDAAVLMPTPLTPVLEAADRDNGSDLVIHMVYLDTEKADVPVAKVPNTFSTVYRLFLLTQARVANSALEGVKTVNDRLRTAELFRSVSTKELDEEEMFMALSKKLNPEAARQWKMLTKDLKDKVRVTVHRHSPTRHVHGFSLFQFRKGRIEELISSGFEDALKHDCKKAGCILPRD